MILYYYYYNNYFDPIHFTDLSFEQEKRGHRRNTLLRSDILALINVNLEKQSVRVADSKLLEDGAHPLTRLAPTRQHKDQFSARNL